MTDNTDVQTGKRIKALRKQLGLTQVGLSKKAGLSPNTIARLERGEHTISTLTVKKLARALNVETSEILGR